MRGRGGNGSGRVHTLCVSVYNERISSLRAYDKISQRSRLIERRLYVRHNLATLTAPV